MDWEDYRGIPNVEDDLRHCHDFTPYFLNCVNLCGAQMEEQRILARGEGVCWGGYWQAEVQEERQGSLLRQKDAAQSKVHWRPSARYWAREKEKSSHEICSSIIATEEGYRPTTA